MRVFMRFGSSGVLSSLTPAQAQSGATETRTMEPYYDIAKEVTLTGTVSTVLTRPSAGMIAVPTSFLPPPP